MQSAKRLPWIGSGSAVLLGSDARELAHLSMLQLALQNKSIHVVDGAIQFNPFKLVDGARSLGIHPDLVLERVTVQRAFSPYQVLDAARDTLHFPERHTVFLSPFKQFLDNDVQEQEALFLLGKLIRLYREFETNHLPVVFSESNRVSLKASVYRQALASLVSSARVYTFPDSDRASLSRAHSFLPNFYSTAGSTTWEEP